ncbi:MAG: FAD-dependent oxidoreductase [Burkholderiales bacterium]|nr:MAG: FAD-dependent oxidoreductase [Burkholderiales bacterium]
MPAGTPAVPVAIVGAGACGQVAAIALRDAGIDCVLLERDDIPRGSTALSSGFVPAAGTAVQCAAGVHDDAAGFARDIRRKAHDTASDVLVDAYAAAIGPAIDRLGRDHGLRFELLDGFLYPGHSVRRMHALAERTGAALVAALDAAAQRAGAVLLTRARVVELWCDAARRVIGVGYERPDGRLEHLGCDALVLACNGFGGNPEMVREWLPEMRDATFGGHVGNDGSAISWGRLLGARLADLGGYQGHGSWAVPQGVLVTWALMTEGGVQVNALGERFHDETEGYSEAAVRVLAQPGGIAWNVFDAPLLALARGFPDFRDAEAAGAVREASGVPALAALIGCDAAVLARTLAAAAPSADAPSVDAPDMAPAVRPQGRTFTRRLEPPFFAVKVTGALFHTQGGLDVDAHCRVLDAEGRPMPNLLAAGGAARGVSGNAVWGYLSGNGLLSAIAGGAIAADTIARAFEEERRA